MNAINIVLSADTFTDNGDYLILYDKVTAKGGNVINLDFTYLDETTFKVKELMIDWGDGTVETHKINIFLDYYNENILPEVRYNKPGTVCLNYGHSYSPSSSAYFNEYAINVIATYINTVKGQYVIPVRIAKASIYDMVGQISIVNAQALSLSSSNTLLNLESEKEFYIIPTITAGSSN